MIDEIHVWTIFYGKDHEKYFSNTMMPTLIKSLNGIHKKIKTKHFIYCNEKDNPDMSISCKEFGNVYVNKHFFKSLKPKMEIHKVIKKQLAESNKSNCCVVIAQCDHIYGYGLDYLITNHYKQYVVCPHARSNLSKFEEIKNFINDEYDNRSLSRFVFNNVPHPMVVNGTKNRYDYWNCEMGNNYVDIFFKEPAPIIFPPNLDIIDCMNSPNRIFGMFEVIDHDYVNWCYKRGDLYFPKNSDEFMWSELTEENKYIPTIFNKNNLDSANYFKKTPYRLLF